MRTHQPRLKMVNDGHLGGYIEGGDPATWCPRLWNWALKRFGVRSVLDVGCGEGHSTKFFRDLGCEVVGVDGCPQAIARSVAPENVVLHDFCDGPFQPGRRFDLVWSCEFLEHVDERYVPHVLDTLALADKAVLVTHAFPGQRGHHHVNCRPSAYWIDLIGRLGFRCPTTLTMQARRVTWRDYPKVNHFARSGLVFKRATKGAPTRHLRLDDVERIGRRPSWSARLQGTLLKGHARLARTLSKLRRRRGG